MKRLGNVRRAQPPQGPPSWVPILGELQKTLQKGEYLPLHPLPMFESNFVQVTNHGGPVFVHHRTNRLTMGVAASLPGLVLPDILLIAQPPESGDCSGLTLTRMIPLDLVHLYVHDLPTWRIKLRLITGHDYYLELDAPDHELGFLFDCWIRLISLLHEPNMTWVPRTLHTPPLDKPLAVAPASTWQLQGQAPSRHSAEVAKNTLPYNSQTAQKQRKAEVLKCRCRSQAVSDSLPLMWSRIEHPAVKKSTKKFHPDARPDRSNTQIHVSDKESITIRTIFSVISSTIKPDRSSPQASSWIRGDSPDYTSLRSYNHRNALKWPQDFEDLMDHESSSLSSSPHLSPYSPAYYCFPLQPSFPRSKAKPMSSMKYQGSLPSKKVPTALVTFRKAPFLLDQSHKVLDVPTLSQKAPAAQSSTQKPRCGLSWKAPPLLPCPQKTPGIPGPSWKTPVQLAPAQKTLTPIQKFPHISAIPQKIMPPPAPKKECLVPHTSSQKSLASPSQCQQVNDSPTSWTKAPVDPGTLPAGIPGGGMLGRSKSEGKQESMVLTGVHEAKVRDMRDETGTRELPSSTVKKDSKVVLVSKSVQVTLEDLRKLEGGSHDMKAEVTVDQRDRKSSEVVQQKRWVTTQELAIEFPRPEDSRPFSVEGLALGKLMTMANSKEQHVKPPVVSLPSWLSMASQASATTVMANVPFTHSLMKPAVVREPESRTRVKNGDVQQWTKREPPWKAVGSSTLPLHSIPTSDSSKMPSSSQVPIPLPATRWDDLPQPHLPESPTSKSEASAKVPQKPVRVPNQGPLATMGSSSEILLPIRLEPDNLKNVATKGKMKQEELDINHPSPSTQLPQHLKYKIAADSTSLKTVQRSPAGAGSP